MSLQSALSKTWKVTKRHQASYTGGKVCASSSGTFLACWSEENIAILEIQSGEVKLVLESEEDDAVSSFALHPHDTHLVTAHHRSNLIKVYHLPSGKLVSQWKGHTLPVLDMCFDPTGTFLATASADRSVRVWNVEKGFCTHSFKGHQAIVTLVAFQPFPPSSSTTTTPSTSVAPPLYVFAGCDNGEIKRWSLTDNTSQDLHSHMSRVNCFCFSADAKTMVSGGRDKVMCVWNLADLSSKTILAYESIDALVSLPRGTRLPLTGKSTSSSAAAPDEYFVAGGDKGVLRVFSYATRKCVHTMAAAGEIGEQGALPEKGDEVNPNAISRLLLLNQRSRSSSSSSSSLAAAGILAVTCEHNLLIFAIPTFSLSKLLVGYNDEIGDVCFVADSPYLLAATNSAQIRTFHTESFNADLLVGHTDIVLSVDVSADGTWAISSSKDNTVRIWKLYTTSAPLPAAAGSSTSDERALERLGGTCVAILRGHAEAVAACCFSNRVPSFLSSSSSSDSAAKIPFLAVSGGRDRTLKLWDCGPLLSLLDNSKKKQKKPSEGRGEQPEKQHEKEKDKLVTIGSKFTMLAHEKDINACRLSPDDSIVASASQDKTIKLWDTKDLSLIGTLKGHRRGVWNVAFSPVDKVLVSCSGDKTLRIWSLSDHSCLKTLQSHTDSVLNVCFINRGLQMLSTGAEGVMKLWTVSQSECVGTFLVGSGAAKGSSQNSTTRDYSWFGANGALISEQEAEAEKKENEARGERAPRGQRGGEEADEEANESKMWGLAVQVRYPAALNANQQQQPMITVATGQSDSALCFWVDMTAVEMEEKLREDSSRVLQEQALANASRKGRFFEAIQLCLQLKYPKKMLSILNEIQDKEVAMFHRRKQEAVRNEKTRETGFIALPDVEGDRRTGKSKQGKGISNGSAAKGKGKDNRKPEEDSEDEEDEDEGEDESGDLRLLATGVEDYAYGCNMTGRQGEKSAVYQPAAAVGVNALIAHDGTGDSVSLKKIIWQLDATCLDTCLEFINEWNTNSRHCGIAQRLLQLLLQRFSVRDWAASAAIRADKDLLPALV